MKLILLEQELFGKKNVNNNSSFDILESLLLNEEPCRAETLQNVRLLEGLTSDETETSEGFFVFMLENDERQPKILF